MLLTLRYAVYLIVLETSVNIAFPREKVVEGISGWGGFMPL